MYRLQMTAAALALCAAVAAAGCQRALNSPASPTAVRESASAANADGSNLKVTTPIAINPLFEQTAVPLTPVLAGRISFGRNVANATFSYRFQVADAESFATIVSSGIGAVDASGIARFTVDPALTANKRYVWRFRAELEDAFGPWSNVMAFTTAGGGGGVTLPGPGGGAPTGPRPADPPPGQRLPLPDMQGVLARFGDARESCPRGLKYVNNPWQDRVIDAFRAVDSRWGYNGKPTRSAADNGGVPVIAAGDEAAYHYSGGPDQGSFDVHLVDMLVGHCGAFPTLTWRVFTGEEPGFWTGAGRF